MIHKKKLIEVALRLAPINSAPMPEKLILHGVVAKSVNSATFINRVMRPKKLKASA